MTGRRSRVATRGDAGLSLIEVIMYSSLTALVLTVLSGLLYAGFKTQAVAGARDAATGAAQVVASSLRSSVSNASGLSVSDTVLRARVATGESGWQCVAWALTGDNTLVYKSASTAISANDFGNWTVLATGVSGGLDAGAAFRGDSTEVTYSFRFASGEVVVPLAGAAVPDAYGPGSPESCW